MFWDLFAYLSDLESVCPSDVDIGILLVITVVTGVALWACGMNTLLVEPCVLGKPCDTDVIWCWLDASVRVWSCACEGAVGAEVLTTACPATVVWVTLNGVNADGCCCRTGGTFAGNKLILSKLYYQVLVRPCWGSKPCQLFNMKPASFLHETLYWYIYIYHFCWSKL